VQVRVGCEFVYHVEVPTHAVTQVEPRLDSGLRVVDERWVSAPPLACSRFVDGYGNLCRRLTMPAGDPRFSYDALIEVTDDLDPESLDAAEMDPSRLGNDTLVFTLPSRFCPSDELGDFAWELFSSVAPGWSRVQAICDWVHSEVTFDYGLTYPTKTALDVLSSRHGVCRDFTHLAIALCRTFNIPARYVFGYLPDIGVADPGTPMDFAAWMEVHLGGVWWTFDPRNNQRRVGRVLVGRGRDALDVAMITTFGGPMLTSMRVWADEVLS
jgi:transglutaminase-like putative cysteine protease